MRASSKIGVVFIAHARIARVRENEVNKEESRVICNPVPTSFQAHRVTYI